MIASFLLPTIVLAQVTITEVMYDVPGADEGREWVEVTNTGVGSVDLTSYRFFENATSHGLKVVSGSGVLAPGASAVIASDAEKFKADYPQFFGILFDSAFALSNKGEMLSLTDASTTVDTISYTAVATTNGTGGSLNRDGSSFTPAMPTPGVYPGVYLPVPETPKKATAQRVSTKKVNATYQNKSTPVASTASFVDPQQQVAALATPSVSLSSPVVWGAALAGIVLLGSAGVLFARMNTSSRETKREEDEFTIE